MKATIIFKEPTNKLAILKAFLDFVRDMDEIPQPVLARGLLFEGLSASEVGALEKALKSLKYYDYTAKEDFLRLMIADGTPEYLFRLTGADPDSQNDFAEMFWKRGFTIENLSSDQGSDFKKKLDDIATVTLDSDSSDTSPVVTYSVSGQIRRPDNTAFLGSDLTVHVLDALSANNFLELGRAAPNPKANYHLSYSWQPDARKGPNLVVRAVTPEGRTVGEVRQSVAPESVTLNITVKNAEPKSFILTATVKNKATGEVLPSVQVEAEFRTSEIVLMTQLGTTDAKGVALLPFDEALFSKISAGHQVEVTFHIQQADKTLDTHTTISNLQSKNQEVEILVTVPEVAPNAPLPAGSRFVGRVSGTIALDYGPAAAAINVRVYQRGFGGVRTLLGEASTDGGGTYTLSYTAKGTPNIEVYAVEPNGQEVQLSRTKFGANADERLDLIAPAAVQPAASEFSRLRAAVSPQLGGKFDALRDALERGPRHDFTLLSNSTGWDATALALASEAVDGEARTGIPAEGFYALARSGLPTNTNAIAHISKQTVANALRQAAQAGIVDDAVVSKGLEAFTNFAADYKFTTGISGAPSSAKDFVAKARISDADRAAFAKVVRDDEPRGLWERAKNAGVSQGAIDKLQLQGKLAYLTFNNAELVEVLVGKVGDNVLALIDLGYGDEDTWKVTIRDLASDDNAKLAALIPLSFTGRDQDERLDVYAAELARRVRQMDPHAVTVQRIASGKLAGVAERDGIAVFLRNAVPVGFRLGQTPLSTFIAGNEAAVWNGIPAEKRDAVLGSVKTLSSLYAASPTDEALSAVLQAGFRSATAIAKADFATFSHRVAPYLPKGSRTRQTSVSQFVYWKAQQQSATVFNVFDGLKRMATPSYAPGSTPEDVQRRSDQQAVARQKLSGMFPTLETLFGSADYCECSTCRSVLSPAAYLVDILHFIDPNEEDWATAKGSYEARTGASYTKSKPFDALNRRRPDIKNIALTCENTNTALPYIDVVNEVLEQLLVADGVDVPDLYAYDVGDASSADLIAEPQNILWSAYVGESGFKGLRDRVYPLALPFDLPLETVRTFLRQLDLPLWRLRQCIARPTTLLATRNDRTDGWTDVWFERLGLSPGDVAAIMGSDDWFALYGFGSEDEALKTEMANSVSRPAASSLRNAKTLSRRLGVSYEELVEILRTRFINPEIEKLIALKRVGVDPNTIDRYFGSGDPLNEADKSGLEADLLAQGLRPADLAPLRTEAMRNATLVLSAPAAGCDFAQATLAFDLAPAAPDAAMALVLLKMNAFVRLQRRLSWEIHELDRALMALVPGVGALTMTSFADAMRTALIYLAHVEELRERFNDRVSREELLLLWSDIPTTGTDCLYERLFTSAGAMGRNPTFDKRLGQVLQDGTAQISDHVDVVRQALQLAYEEIEPILKSAQAGDRLLSISNLSMLGRYGVLARGLDLPIADLLSLLSLSEHKPFTALPNMPLTELAQDTPWVQALAFVDEVALLGKAGIGVSFLDRQCRHRGVSPPPYAASDPASLALALLPAADQAASEKLSALIVQTLAGQLSAPVPLVEALVSKVLKDAGGKFIKESGFSDPEHTVYSLRKLRKALDLIQSLEVTAAELDYLMNVPGAVNPNDLPLDEVVDDARAQALRKGLAPWIDFVAIRRSTGRSERLLAVLRAAEQPLDVQNTVAAREAGLRDAFGALTGLKVDLLPALLVAIGATPTAGPTFSVLVMKDPARLRESLEAIKCCMRLSLRPEAIVDLATVYIDEKVAQKLRTAVKARYPRSAWRKLAQPIFDRLRKKQRDALVVHLTHVLNAEGQPRYGETMEKLFEHLLLDPGMEPVVLASRIQLAISSVQLFVQRCLMNLEPDRVDPQIIDTKRWEWMRRYRVWEVNRKMFIWPENWLDPEFRDDRTHLFRALEGNLLQGDVNDDLVRAALYEYLKGLETIARLEMLTMYFEPGISADGSIVHLVGRTPSAPFTYLYRNISHGIWTPWEPIEMHIEGEHLVLAPWRGRMHLFWVTFLEQTLPIDPPPIFTPASDTVDTRNLRGPTYVKVQLHWAERIDDKWTNRGSTSGFVDTAFMDCKATSDEEKRGFFVRTVVIENEAGAQDDDLEIHITNENKGHKFVFFSKLAPPRSESDSSAPTLPPFDAISPKATKWVSNEQQPLSITFVSAVSKSSVAERDILQRDTSPILDAAHNFSLLFPTNETLPVPSRTPPAGVGRPHGFVFEPQNAQHVVYRGGDGSIYDMFGDRTGWFYQSPSLEAAGSSTLADAESAASDPYGYGVDDRGMLCIAYAGETRIHELVWSQLDADMGDGRFLGTEWRVDTLYSAVTANDRPQGRPLGGMYLPNRGVVFRTADGRLRAVVESTADGTWDLRELGVGAPKPASDPAGLLMTKTELAMTRVTSRHLFYIGVDGHVHELRSDNAGLVWTYTNITQAMTGVVMPAPNASLSAYAFLLQNTLHVVYRGRDDKIHELWGFPGSWNYNPIGTPFTKAKGDPFGYVIEWAGSQHVVYRGEGDELVGLQWWRGAWYENVLTHVVPGALKVGSDTTGYSFESSKQQHVVYFDESGRPRELYWDGSWFDSGYPLSNPFPDSLSALAAPFFYEERGSRPHTFFVEPSVVETTVHEWTEWIVTRRERIEYVQPKTLAPLHPEAIAVTPDPTGILRNADRARKYVNDIPVIVRTPRGVIDPRTDVSTKGVARVTAEASASPSSHFSPKLVDVTKGVNVQVTRDAVDLARLKGVFP
ncbi:neuraminidase-like domain-containing protein [Nitrosovibrio sp. Nv4]|uniref:neuraminidase-like domain-containing protein n=1 Tax=Nitrosovibrio sp. Nv4 TaxID=1945880 RepID=UPI000BC90E66|nr:neuraminidase-like domain-containing protein [Nitrosovibrio sp. Nv4]SOD42217.1 virulence plasmid A protein [Nitrosovibrio sp. Nv4]